MKAFIASSLLALAVGAFASTPQGAMAQSAQPGEESANSGSDIVVTAQRRSERLVDVPISVATASAADLERAGPNSIDSLTKITPGVYFQRAQYGLSPTVRGIGSTLSTSGGEQIVALYVDNIYYAAPTGTIFDLASIAGVELLKGPQGTLFGRNATGGAVLLRTLDPGFTPAGRVNVSYERFDQIRTSAYLNLPLGDMFAVNGSIAYRHSKGYIRDLRTNRIVNEGDNLTARGKLLFQPTDNFSVIFTMAHADLDDPTGTTSQSLQPAPLLIAASGGPIANDRFHTSKATQEVTKVQSREYSARAKLDTDFGTLSSYTALVKNKLNTTNDVSNSYLRSFLDLEVRSKTFSQEVNFTSPADQPLSYVVGVYYFRSTGVVPYLTSNNTALSNSRSRSRAIAGYADGTYKFGDLSVIAGIRYSLEKRRTASAIGVSAPSPFTRFQETVDKQWTPRLGLRYALGDRSNVYATYSKGFKSGVFDATTATGPGVKPETVDAFELGFKSASRDLSFNAAAFYYDYKNTQVNATVSGNAGAIFNQLFNVPKSRIWGAEADATLRLSDNFDLRVAAAYTNARYIDFDAAPGFELRGMAPPPPAVDRRTFTNISLDASGNQMVRAPKITASSTLSYHTPIGGDHELEISVSPYYSSRVYHTFDNSLSQAPYFTLDAAATLTWNEHIKMSVFGRNLTDAKYYTRMSQNTLSLNNVVYAAPLTYGVSLGFQF